ncbi:hypothetical protein Airi02_095120 [Actinoallomurus iriomotensis]|uniref:Uncharacterized protein n=1 Tax=Actinoallomurus iriomotensis TaxID=478107 RepID=A0A9W6W5K5_9ACTN|nr:hypothetical protein Airi02_095120 [Actinoallomurus iriomotensis]
MKVGDSSVAASRPDPCTSPRRLLRAAAGPAVVVVVMNPPPEARGGTPSRPATVRRYCWVSGPSLD